MTRDEQIANLARAVIYMAVHHDDEYPDLCWVTGTPLRNVFRALLDAADRYEDVDSLLRTLRPVEVDQ